MSETIDTEREDVPPILEDIKETIQKCLQIFFNTANKIELDLNAFEKSEDDTQNKLKLQKIVDCFRVGLENANECFELLDFKAQKYNNTNNLVLKLKNPIRNYVEKAIQVGNMSSAIKTLNLLTDGDNASNSNNIINSNVSNTKWYNNIVSNLSKDNFTNIVEKEVENTSSKRIKELLETLSNEIENQNLSTENKSNDKPKRISSNPNIIEKSLSFMRGTEKKLNNLNLIDEIKNQNLSTENRSNDKPKCISSNPNIIEKSLSFMRGTEKKLNNLELIDEIENQIFSTEHKNNDESSIPTTIEKNMSGTEKKSTYLELIDHEEPKGKIRLVAIEKLLEPGFNKHKDCPNLHLDENVITLDSNEEDEPIKITPRISKSKHARRMPKSKLQKKFNKILQKPVMVRIELCKSIENLLKNNKRCIDLSLLENLKKTGRRNNLNSQDTIHPVKNKSNRDSSIVLSSSSSIAGKNKKSKVNGKVQLNFVDKENNMNSTTILTTSSDSDDDQILSVLSKKDDKFQEANSNDSDKSPDELSANKKRPDSAGGHSSTDKSIFKKKLRNFDGDKDCMSQKRRKHVKKANQVVESGSSDDENTTAEKMASVIKKESLNENKRRNKSKGINSSGSSSSSDFVQKKKKRKLKKYASDSLSSDNEKERKEKRKTKRKRIKHISNTDSSASENDSHNKQRKNIRKLIKTKDLDSFTKKAAKDEEERLKRIEERQKLYNVIYKQPENVELDNLVLDFDEETKEPLIEVDSGLLQKLKPHQAQGVKFMWDACFETLKDIKTKPGSGCILAHCMGLGKTLQVIALTHTLLSYSKITSVERVLVMAPISTLTNWAREFFQWLKFCKKNNIEVYDMSKWKDKNQRAYKLKEWYKDGGVCIIGYDMFRILSNPKSTAIAKKMRQTLQMSLVDPGPDLVICDEGHLLKNEKTSLSQAVNRIKTLRRIVLTGTPLQNNLKEYYCMIQFIKPNLLGTYKEYLNRFVNPIINGQYTDSTTRDIQLMKNRSHVLHKLLEGCIQRRDYSVLSPYLPPKHEYVVFITLSDIQKTLYKFYMEKVRKNTDETGKGALLFKDYQNLRRIWTHPMSLRVNSDIVIKKRLLKELYDSEGSLEDFIVEDKTSSSESEEDLYDSDKSIEQGETNFKKRCTRQNNYKSESDIEEKQEDDPSEWWKSLCPEEELNNINHSPKLIILMDILQECNEIGDKVLLFSQSLQSLDVIEHFLSIIDKKTRNEVCEGEVNGFSGSWIQGEDYFRLDGSSNVENREFMCKEFNDVNNLRARLFLISTRAGGLGINLVAANRVVIFDVSWNPSHDTQSIFRVYRFGQNKPCYIYRLIAMGTMEEKIYERQVTKQATAKRVLDEQQIGRHYNQNDLLELYKYEIEQSEVREIPSLPKDRLFADLIQKYEKFLFKYHEHDSLLESEESENLNEEERKAAWAEYEDEKNRPASLSYYNRPNINTNGPVTSNKLYGFRTDILLQLLNMKITKDHPLIGNEEIMHMVPLYLQQLNAQMNVNNTTMYKELLELNRALETPQGPYGNSMPPNYITPSLQTNPYAYAQQRPPGQSGLLNPSTDSCKIYEIEE